MTVMKTRYNNKSLYQYKFHKDGMSIISVHFQELMLMDLRCLNIILLAEVFVNEERASHTLSPILAFDTCKMATIRPKSPMALAKISTIRILTNSPFF